MSPMTSSSFLRPLQCPSVHAFSPAQSTKTAILPQLGGRGRTRTEQRLYSYSDDKKVTLERRQVDNRVANVETENVEYDHYFRYSTHHLPFQPEFWYISPPDVSQKLSSQLDVDLLMNNPQIAVGSQVNDEIELNDVKQFNALLLAKEAMLASKEAADLARFNFTDADLEASKFSSHDEPSTTRKTTVRSGRLLERRSKKRKVLRRNSVSHNYFNAITTDTNEKVAKALNSNDPLALFLCGPETRRLLTVKEEKDLFSQIEELMKIEEVKQRLHLQFGREPTLNEWAEAVGLSYHELQSCVFSGKLSRDKMIYANFRLVVHIAKHYQGKGLNLQDLLQVGSMGLMKSLEKFKPKAGCRFPTYAYWWIRQSIKKAIFQNSRVIRLPENVFSLLKKIKSTRMSCIQQGNYPSNSELAKLVGISVEKLEQLLFSTRSPVSIQENIWADQDVTMQEITADPKVETPDLCVAKQMMRQHARNLLGVLPPRERQIIRFRYGLHDGEPKSLQDIGNMYGLSKERVRQLESRAMDKLKRCLIDQGLEAYVCLLT